MAVVNAGLLYGCEEVGVGALVDEYSVACLGGEHAVDEEVFFVVGQGAPDGDGAGVEVVALEFAQDDLAEVVGVDGVVGAEGCGVVVEEDVAVWVVLVVVGEVGYEFGEFALVFDVEGA